MASPEQERDSEAMAFALDYYGLPAPTNEHEERVLRKSFAYQRRMLSINLREFRAAVVKALPRWIRRRVED